MNRAFLFTLLTFLLTYTIGRSEVRRFSFFGPKMLSGSFGLFSASAASPLLPAVETKLPNKKHEPPKIPQISKNIDEYYLNTGYSVRIIAPISEDAERLLFNLKSEFTPLEDEKSLENIVSTALSKGTAKMKRVASLEEAFSLKHRLRSCGAKAVIIDEGSNHEVFQMPKPEAVRDKIEYLGYYEVLLHCPAPEERDTVVETMIRYYSGTEMTIEEIADLVDKIPSGGSVSIAETKNLDEAMNIVEWLLDRKTQASVEYRGSHHQRHSEIPGVFPILRHSPHYTPDDYFW